MKNIIKLGNRVRVSDPCYGTKVWCSGELNNVKEGKYEVEVVHQDCGNWGTRVAMLRVTHEDYSGIPVGFNAEAEFEVGVDSGTAGIFDAYYYEKYHTEEDVNDDWYDAVGELTFTKEQFGTLDDKCVVSSSGFGDGGYQCLLTKDPKGRIVSIGIIFIMEDECEGE